MSENIQLNIDEIEEEEEEEKEGKKEGILLSELIDNIKNTILMDNNEKYKEYEESIKVSQMIDYQMNYTVKQLIVICDYYGILKQIKCNKCNKDEIIHILIDFENDESHPKPPNNFRQAPQTHASHLVPLGIRPANAPPFEKPIQVAWN